MGKNMLPMKFYWWVNNVTIHLIFVLILIAANSNSDVFAGIMYYFFMMEINYNYVLSYKSELPFDREF